MDAHISSAILPNGRMYYNISDRVFNNLLPTSHQLVSDYATQVQTDLNHAANIGIRRIPAGLNLNRGDNLAQYSENCERGSA